MARLIVQGSDLTLRMNPLELFGAVHGQIRVPLRNVIDIAVTDTLWTDIYGARMPGMGFRGVIALGTWRYDNGKDFAAIYSARGIIVSLTDSPWNRLLVSARNPRAVYDRIGTHR